MREREEKGGENVCECRTERIGCSPVINTARSEDDVETLSTAEVGLARFVEAKRALEGREASPSPRREVTSGTNRHQQSPTQFWLWTVNRVIIPIPGQVHPIPSYLSSDGAIPCH